MRKHKGCRLVVVVSDTHCGSTQALFPEKFKIAEGQIVTGNAIQRWFLECWNRSLAFIDEVAAGDPFALILNGDLIEGDHHRTDQIVGRNKGDHVRIAERVLAPLVERAEKLFVVRGTECHTEDHEAAIAEHFQAEKNPETGRRVFDRLTLDVCGVRLVARHHMTTTSRPWLETNGLGYELASEQLNAARNGEPLPRVLCCAHRHIAGHAVTTEGVCVATPAWQALTRHGHKVVPSSRCKPGVYMLDWRSLSHEDLPIIRRKIFAAPQPTAVAI